MNEALLPLLADPETHAGLSTRRSAAGEPESLISESGASYPVRARIPRFTESADDGQAQTADAFGFKWGKVDSYSSEARRASATDWLLRRYGFASAADMRSHLEMRSPVLDIGCGSGFATSLWFDDWRDGLYVGIDLSTAIDIAGQRLGARAGTAFVQGDALQLPFRNGAFGAAISEGVFHHTPSTSAAISEAARVLRDGGELLFYVYRTKSPMREFADDHVRAYVAPLTNEETWLEMERLTSLGKALAELRVDVEVTDPVDSLGIPAGRFDVQRLVYWHFAKVFWNSEYSFDENVHINFDWYRPTYSHRQTEEQVRGWCADAGLEITHFDRDPAGFTVRAIKRGAG